MRRTFIALIILGGCFTGVAAYAQPLKNNVCGDRYTIRLEQTVKGATTDTFVIEPQCPKSNLIVSEPAPNLLKVMDRMKIIDQPPALPADAKPSAQQADSLVVLFDLNSSVIWPHMRNQIEEFAHAHQGESVSVDGYACWIGTDKYNVWLSERRARKVAAMLRSNGLTIQMTQAHGESSLVDKGFPAPNRRVNIHLKGGDASAGKNELSDLRKKPNTNPQSIKSQ